MSFVTLGLSDTLIQAITDMGYDTPTPIQERAIPQILMNRDVLASAQTGTGKTASFALPIMDILSDTAKKSRMPKAIIIEPTRELAVQVQENFDKYAKYTSFSTAIVIGGTSMASQEKTIAKGVDVIIATPGRLLDLIERSKVLLNEVKIFVIDEADRMLDMGFIPDIEKLTQIMPKNRQNIMFSATYPNNIKKLAKKFLDNPKEIIVSPPSSTSDTITQWVVPLDKPTQKYDALMHLMDTQPIKNAIIFCNRKRDVDAIYKKMDKAGIRVGALHGDMNQNHRIACLETFKNDQITYLVCSDVAARGLDIPEVSHVINMDIPSNSEDYVHRIGRTGRAGNLGNAFTLQVPKDKPQWDSILKLINKCVQSYPIDFAQKPVQNTQKSPKKPSQKIPFGIQEMCAEDVKKPFGQQHSVPAFLLSK